MAVIHYHPDHACNLAPGALEIVKRMIASSVSTHTEGGPIEDLTFTLCAQPLGWHAVVIEARPTLVDNQRSMVSD